MVKVCELAAEHIRRARASFVLTAMRLSKHHAAGASVGKRRFIKIAVSHGRVNAVFAGFGRVTSHFYGFGDLFLVLLQFIDHILNPVQILLLIKLGS